MKTLLIYTDSVWGYPPAGAAVAAESIGTTEVGDVAIGGKRLESWCPILSLDEIPVFEVAVCVKSKVLVVRVCNLWRDCTRRPHKLTGLGEETNPTLLWVNCCATSMGDSIYYPFGLWKIYSNTCFREASEIRSKHLEFATSIITSTAEDCFQAPLATKRKMPASILTSEQVNQLQTSINQLSNYLNMDCNWTRL